MRNVTSVNFLCFRARTPRAGSSGYYDGDTAFSISGPGRSTPSSCFRLMTEERFCLRVLEQRSRPREELEVVQEVAELLLAELLLAEIEDPREPEPEQALALDLEEEVGKLRAVIQMAHHPGCDVAAALRTAPGRNASR